MCCLFCWYLQNCSPSAFKRSFNVQHIYLPQRSPVLHAFLESITDIILDLSMFYLFCICVSHHHTGYYLYLDSYSCLWVFMVSLGHSSEIAIEELFFLAERKPKFFADKIYSDMSFFVLFVCLLFHFFTSFSMFLRINP